MVVRYLASDSMGLMLGPQKSPTVAPTRLQAQSRRAYTYQVELSPGRSTWQRFTGQKQGEICSEKERELWRHAESWTALLISACIQGNCQSRGNEQPKRSRGNTPQSDTGLGRDRVLTRQSRKPSWFNMPWVEEYDGDWLSNREKKSTVTYQKDLIKTLERWIVCK